jgi:MinD superfamily P-loop ATPase
MKIAVLSGKGGTGKTLVSVNLAAASDQAVYVDCDVEEPNGHLFFKPQNLETELVAIPIPQVDESRCTGCRKCVDFCKFNALAYIGTSWVIFEDICHSCGGCVMICPEKALSEKTKEIGEVTKGTSDNVMVLSGMMNIGEASGIPIIKKLLQNENLSHSLAVIDCPPGSACTVMESIKDADYCILVAEPSIFGAHNLNLVVELVKLFHKPHGVILNKCLDGINPSEEYCKENGLHIIGSLPYDKELGTMNAIGLVAVRESQRYHDIFTGLLQAVMKEVGHEAASNT